MEKKNEDLIKEKTQQSTRLAKQLPPSVQFAIAKVLPNITNGAFWGFCDMKAIQEHIEDLKSEQNITVRKLSNACLVEVNPKYILDAALAVDPNIFNQSDLNFIQQSMSDAVVSFENVLVQGSMNLVDGAINNGEVVDSIIPEIQYNSINNELTVTAIMLPNQNLENINVNILLSDNSNYSWNPGQYILTQNTRLKFSLNLTPTLVELKSSNSSILDWDDIVEDQIIDIQPDYPDSSGDLPDEEEVPTGGTIDNPYTVSGAILKQGETSVWVEGYIMGYAIKTMGEPNTLGTDPSHGQSELNIVLADDTLETDLGLMLPVMFSLDTQSNTDAKQNLNLKTNNNLIGEKVKILCDLAEYLRVPGGRNITVYEILGSEG